MLAAGITCMALALTPAQSKGSVMCYDAEQRILCTDQPVVGDALHVPSCELWIERARFCSMTAMNYEQCLGTRRDP